MKRKLPLIIVNALLLVAFFVCLGAYGAIRNLLRSQQAAVAWAGQSGERFAQLSAFLPDGAAFDENSIRTMRESIDTALTEASLEEEEGRVLYADAWAALGEVSIVGSRGLATAQAIGVGGDFFLFHPLYLRDGSYLSPNDLMKDRIVLDEELAWRLFGAVHLEGFEVTIGNKLHIIAGVVSREDDFASKKAYTGGAGVFMSYDALNELTEGNAEIFCYELVMPDPITGFAVKSFEESFPNKDAAIVENSARYSLISILRIIGSLGERSMRTDGIVFPYWENAARYTEDRLALLLVLLIVFAACPAVCGVIYGTKGIRFLIRRGKSAAKKRIEERDDREAKKYREENADEFKTLDSV